jgi:hypothetical protein
LIKNNSIPPKRIKSRMAKNGEVSPFNLNNKYEITSNPNKNPRRELLNIKLKTENVKIKRRNIARSKTENVKPKMGN